MTAALHDVAHALEPAVPQDYLRYAVLAFGAWVWLLYLRALRRVHGRRARSRRRERRRGGAAAVSRVQRGREAQIIGALLLLGDGLVGLVGRMGEHSIGPRTPLLQLALLAYLVAYNDLDRRAYHDIDEAVSALTRKIKRGEL